MDIKEKVIRAHQDNFGHEPTVVVQAPGRINLIGEHTDYNGGLVLPGAIDKYMCFSCSPNKTQMVNAVALDKKKSISLDLDDLKKTDLLWADYLTGILREFKKVRPDITGFDCAFASDVPIGAGMSSSAALECAMLYGVNELYDMEIEHWNLIEMSRSSNHDFLGIKGGIMDQFASLFGKEKNVMLLDCDSMNFNYISIQPGDYSWVLINSCVKHNHLTSGYNDRVRECGQALKDIKKAFPDTKNLSSIKEAAMLSDVHFSSPVVQSRARFVVEENARVRSFVSHLGDELEACGKLLYASHAGLRDDYEVSCAELDWLVESLRGKPGVLGSRMMGGGFGGCTINLVHKDSVDNITHETLDAYKAETGIDAEVYEVNISNGATRLS